jgi:hypothetical protein
MYSVPDPRCVRAAKLHSNAALKKMTATINSAVPPPLLDT